VTGFTDGGAVARIAYDGRTIVFERQFSDLELNQRLPG